MSSKGRWDMLLVGCRWRDQQHPSKCSRVTREATHSEAVLLENLLARSHRQQILVVLEEVRLDVERLRPVFHRHHLPLAI